MACAYGCELAQSPNVMMGHSCCVCGNTGLKDPYIVSFHCFPKDTVTLVVWLEVLDCAKTTSKRLVDRHYFQDGNSLKPPGATLGRVLRGMLQEYPQQSKS